MKILIAILISVNAFAQHPERQMPLFNRDSKLGKASKEYKKSCKMGALVGAILGGFLLGVTNLEGDDDIPNMGAKDALTTMALSTGIGCAFGTMNASMRTTIYEDFVGGIESVKYSECLALKSQGPREPLRCELDWAYSAKTNRAHKQIIALILTNAPAEIHENLDIRAVSEYVLSEINRIEYERDGN